MSLLQFQNFEISWRRQKPCKGISEVLTKMAKENFNTAKIVTTWECNLSCNYCCNRDLELRATFKPITQQELQDLPHSDFEITGGEPMLPSRFSQTICVLDWLPPNRNVYLYTNGMYFGNSRAGLAYGHILKRHGVRGINVGYHGLPLDWKALRKVNSIIPIRLWIKEDEVEKWLDETPYCGFEIRRWNIGDCYAITTDRYVLDVTRK